jgi:hypothetical protein
MTECRICKGKLTRIGQEPNVIKRLPLSIVQDPNFKKWGAPIKVCPDCDGDVFALAQAKHASQPTV